MKLFILGLDVDLHPEDITNDIHYFELYDRRLTLGLLTLQLEGKKKLEVTQHYP